MSLAYLIKPSPYSRALTLLLMLPMFILPLHPLPPTEVKIPFKEGDIMVVGVVISPSIPFPVSQTPILCVKSIKNLAIQLSHVTIDSIKFIKVLPQPLLLRTSPQ